MSTSRDILEAIRDHSVGTLYGKALRKSRVLTRRALQRLIDQQSSTYSDIEFREPLLRYFPTLSLDPLPEDVKRIRAIAGLYCAHRFDVLGSGWISAAHGAAAPGFEGVVYTGRQTGAPGSRRAAEVEAHLIYPASHHAWSLLGDPEYVPIDWHRDHKSGFRWLESSHSSYLTPGHPPGVDVKVPWELARMHHLATLAYAYRLASCGADGFDSPVRYAMEFRNQLIDFIATNPPRRGVNWACTMDVGIRVANWLVSYELFRAFGCHFDVDFEHVFERSIYEHGQHCFDNLEDSGPARGNHYLADIAGLLFAAAFLPRSTETDGWLAFAVQELALEMAAQFHEDGSNFEGSTCYHALSLDIVVHCALLCLLLGPDKREALLAGDGNRGVHRRMRRLALAGVDPHREELFDTGFWVRLARGAEFIRDIRRPDGLLPQIGDNDSGRFLKLWPAFERLTAGQAIERYRQLGAWRGAIDADSEYWDEIVLDYDSICVAAEVLFSRRDLAAPTISPVRTLLEQILGSKTVPDSRHHGRAWHPMQPAAQPRARSLDTLVLRLQHRYGAPLVTEFYADPGSPLTDGLSVHGYPGMGIFVVRSPRLYLLIRCGEVGQLGNGGHAHNDQLSIELVLDNHDVVRDPGTYVYTPSSELRNTFRSTTMHFTPRIGGSEQNDWREGGRGLFSLIHARGGTCEHLSECRFAGSHSCFGRTVWRLIEIQPDRVVIQDFGADSAGDIPTLLSNGYGRWLR